MITPKSIRCQRYCWAYITKYPGVSARDIAGAQGDYSWQEVNEALKAIEGVYIRREHTNPYAWSPIIPFVWTRQVWAI